MGASTLTDPNVVTCPKCGKEVWDNRLTKKGNQPDYRCKNRACDGAIWLKKKADLAPTGPAFLHNAAAEDAAELAGKIGEGKPKMRDAYKDLTKWVLKEIAPLYYKEFGECRPDVASTITATLFIQACKSGKVE